MEIAGSDVSFVEEGKRFFDGIKKTFTLLYTGDRLNPIVSFLTTNRIMPQSAQTELRPPENARSLFTIISASLRNDFEFLRLVLERLLRFARNDKQHLQPVIASES